MRTTGPGQRSLAQVGSGVWLRGCKATAVPPWEGPCGEMGSQGGRVVSGLTDAVLGLEDLVVVLSVLDLSPGLAIVLVILAAGAAALTL